MAPPPDVYTRILIRDLRVDMLIGIHAAEKAAAQPVLVNLAGTLAQAGPLPDDIAATADYETLSNAIRALAAAGHINLLETFAEKIAALALKDSVLADVTVRVEKPDILGAASVGVEIHRRR